MIGPGRCATMRSRCAAGSNTATVDAGRSSASPSACSAIATGRGVSKNCPACACSRCTMNPTRRTRRPSAARRRAVGSRPRAPTGWAKKSEKAISMGISAHAPRGSRLTAARTDRQISLTQDDTKHEPRLTSPNMIRVRRESWRAMRTQQASSGELHRSRLSRRQHALQRTRYARRVGIYRKQAPCGDDNRQNVAREVNRLVPACVAGHDSCAIRHALNSNYGVSK
mmetsp:Transcript_61164/g.144498  ORF Transcript_61164/g.144498 Transcript_61164/m.144498 type:complete len:226 (-) Transcript_61164:1121-1798(-)